MHQTLVSGPNKCRWCAKSFEVIRFDPPAPAVSVPLHPALNPGDSAPCVNHAGNVAIAACQRCGQFMCALCRIEAEQKSYCPSCFDRMTADGTLQGAQLRFPNYGGWAATCIIAGILLWFASPILAPLGLVFSIMGIRSAHTRGETELLFGLYMRAVICLFQVLLVVFVIVGVAGGFD